MALTLVFTFEFLDQVKIKERKSLLCELLLLFFTQLTKNKANETTCLIGS